MEEALTGRGRPSLKQLHDHHVLREAAIKWRYIGFNLLNDVTALDIIEANYKQNIERCCQEMFKKWLETHEDASWYQLIKALKRVELIHLASQIELLLGDDNAVSSTISNDQTNNIKLVTFEDLEVEFARTTNKIKQTLKNNHIDIMSLVEQLQTISAVKDKKVPLLDEDVFENVTTIEKLWKKLNRYWSIVDYDVLRIVLKLVRCKQADDILEEFLSRIDITIIKDVDLVLYYEAFESKGLVKPSLRIKVKIDNYADCIKAEVEKVMSSKFNLEEYSLRFRGIKEGCIELVYEISNAMMEYFLQCKFTGNDMIYFAACTIISVYINDMELLIPPEIEMDRKYEWLAAVQTGHTKETVIRKGGGTQLVTNEDLDASKLKGFTMQVTKNVDLKKIKRINTVAGVAIGAAVGSVLPVVGTVIGGVVGGMVGRAIGRSRGRKIIRDHYNSYIAALHCEPDMYSKPDSEPDSEPEWCKSFSYSCPSEYDRHEVEFVF